MANKVSIVVPVYNAAHCIERCIDSIVRQSYSTWELILVNDGSSDASLDLCEKYQHGDERIIIHNQGNAGPSAARNKGISLAKGKYLVFIDSDDFVHGCYLEKLLKPFQKDVAVELSCGGYFELSNYYKNGLPLHDFDFYLENPQINKNQFLTNIFHGVSGVVWGKLFLTEIIHKYSIKMDDRIRLSEDLLFVFEYASYISKIALVKEHLYYYNRLNEHSLSRQLTFSNLIDIQLTTYKLKELASNFSNLYLIPYIDKRYTVGIINLTKDIALSDKKLKVKTDELTLVFAETTDIIRTGLNLDFVNSIHLYLFFHRHFLSIIFYNHVLNKLRYLKRLLVIDKYIN
jgi:glycosyltransferase involved in cell wall biosynthesis